MAPTSCPSCADCRRRPRQQACRPRGRAEISPPPASRMGWPSMLTNWPSGCMVKRPSRVITGPSGVWIANQASPRTAKSSGLLVWTSAPAGRGQEVGCPRRRRTTNLAEGGPLTTFLELDAGGAKAGGVWPLATLSAFGVQATLQGDPARIGKRKVLSARVFLLSHLSDGHHHIGGDAELRRWNSVVSTACGEEVGLFSSHMVVNRSAAPAASRDPEIGNVDPGLDQRGPACRHPAGRRNRGRPRLSCGPREPTARSPRISK